MNHPLLSFLPKEWQRKEFGDHKESPKGKLVGKFVLIKSEDIVTLVLGLVKEFKYHAHLVDQFCQVNKIPSGWRHKPDAVEIYDSRYEVRGGGWIEINVRLSTVKFYGHSTAYGTFRRSDVETCLSKTSLFDRFRISIVN